MSVLLATPAPSIVLFQSRARLLASALLSSMVLAACGGGSADAPVAGSALSTQDSGASVASAAGKDGLKERLASVSSFDTASANKVADENQTFTLTAQATVYFGAAGSFRATVLPAGTYRATSALLGDPAPDVQKAAYVIGTEAIATFDPAKAIRLTGEGGSFTLTTASTVFYGANTTYTSLPLDPGTYTAGATLFGDPVPGVAKAAYVMSATAIVPFDLATATKIANESAQFTLSSAGTVYFGGGGLYATRSLAAGTYYASAAVFGDPAPGMQKAAYVMGTASITPFDVNAATKVADESGSFTLTSDGTVFFGASGSYTSKQLVAGTYQATAALLGDPIPGVAKQAYVVGTSSITVFDPASATKLAAEGEPFYLSAAAQVYFGANGKYTSKMLAAGTYTAGSALLGDPIGGVLKSAYVVGTTSIPQFDAAAASRIAGEGQQFVLASQSVVFFGAGSTYTSRLLAAGTYTADSSVFADPAPGMIKSVYVASSSSTVFDLASATKLASEGEPFYLSATAQVFFGANGKYASRTLAAGSYTAGSALLGNPIDGVPKSAYVMGTTSIPTFDPNMTNRIAGESQSFTLTTQSLVFFGAGSNYAARLLAAGTYTADGSVFADLAPGMIKSVYVATTSSTAFDPAGATKIAAEGEPFYLSAPAQVFFGANGKYASKTLPAGTYTAGSALLGNPIDGVLKSAYVVGTASLPTFDAGAANRIAGESQQFTLAYQSVVFFGAGSNYTSRLLAPGTYTANNALFADLAPGMIKSVYVLTSIYSGPQASAPPTITMQPSSAVAGGGQAATFGVVATSETMVEYQWTRNGTAIVGATGSSYTIAATQLSDSGVRFAVTVKNNAGATTSTAAVLTVNASLAQAATALRPFSDQSLWNSRPTQVTLGTYQVPTSWAYPTVAEGDLSVGAFPASNSDPAVSVMGPVGAQGIWIADAETYSDQITIPHWPANTTPATGGDGHADIVDVAGNKIHSFYQLKKVGNQWRASQYTWTALDGRGWGTPGQYFQGSRATGVVPIAGLIRTVELSDGLPSYKHALAMSMTASGLSPNPTYTFPATSADVYSDTTNTGGIPEGSLMMLPADFDLSQIKDPRLLKIVRTLQSYGAYVVDANTGSPFVIYVELGSGFQLMKPGVWDAEIAAELDLIRSKLRQAVTTSNWVDANGAPFVPERNLNMLSLRGSWYVTTGTTAGTFDTWTQSVKFADNGQFTSQINATGRSVPDSLWGGPVAGKSYRLQVTATGGATMQMTLVDGSGTTLHATAELGGTSAHVFTWPATKVTPYFRVSSGPNGGGTVTATLLVQ